VTDARKFLENVLGWPGSAQTPGWINLHVNAKNDPKPGEPIKNVHSVHHVVNGLEWPAHHPWLAAVHLDARVAGILQR